ncbi:MAG: glycosyltransferase family 9 protein [Bacteroidetes bacterium]|nr:glycosyltransferase family 9 protein [Bacteroidota bacterium]
MTTPKNKVLIIRLSSIGDIVLTSPIIRCLKEQLPGIEIHYLVKKQFQPLLIANPYISKIWLYEGSLSRLIQGLKAEKFDNIIDLHKNYRSCYVRSRLGKSSSSFPKLNYEKWLMVNLKINRLPGIHIVDRYFKAVQKAGVDNDGKGLDYFIPQGEEVRIDLLPKEFQNGFIAFVIGGKHITKILPEDKVIELCSKIAQPVILLGGKEDQERGERIVSKAGGALLNTCGLYSINQSASLIRQATRIITNDTGLMHIAAAFRKPVISVWGNTIPEFGMYPYLPEGLNDQSKIVEVKGLDCRPCSKIGFDKCPKKHFKCMNDQNTGSMVQLLEKGWQCDDLC